MYKNEKRQNFFGRYKLKNKDGFSYATKKRIITLYFRMFRENGGNKKKKNVADDDDQK